MPSIPAIPSTPSLPTSAPVAKPVEAKKSNLIDIFLDFDSGEVKLGGVLLPGILMSMTVNGGIKFDKAERDAMSGKEKTPKGWDDTEVKIVLDLLCDQDPQTGTISDCYAKLNIINKLFKAGAGSQKENPKIYDISNKHLQARGVSLLIFYGLQSDEDDQSDVIRATLTFVEHLPPQAKRETAANTATASTAAPKTTATPALAPAIVKDDTLWAVEQGFHDGRYGR